MVQLMSWGVPLPIFVMVASCLFLRLFVCLFICLFVCLFVCLLCFAFCLFFFKVRGIMEAMVIERCGGDVMEAMVMEDGDGAMAGDGGNGSVVMERW